MGEQATKPSGQRAVNDSSIRFFTFFDDAWRLPLPLPTKHTKERRSDRDGGGRTQAAEGDMPTRLAAETTLSWLAFSDFVARRHEIAQPARNGPRQNESNENATIELAVFSPHHRLHSDSRDERGISHTAARFPDGPLPWPQTRLVAPCTRRVEDRRCLVGCGAAAVGVEGLSAQGLSGGRGKADLTIARRCHDRLVLAVAIALCGRLGVTSIEPFRSV